MAQDPDRPLDDGKVRLPRVDAGMNRIAPAERRGSKDSDRSVAFRTTSQLKDPRDPQFLYKMRRRYEMCVKADSEGRKDELDDNKFYVGDQWPADIVAQRNQDHRPCITVNKLPTFVHQVTNEQRMNRLQISVSPIGDRGDPEAAKMYRGLIRYFERESQADIAYDWAFECAAKMGEGYWRTLTEYSAPDSFRQTIVIRRIRNHFTVHLDPNHQEPDGDDAKFGFITEWIPRDEFKRLWPDADPMPWNEGGIGEQMREWIGQYNIRIAEYFEIETEKRRLVKLSNGHVGWWDEVDPEVKSRLEVVDSRESDVPKVSWYKVTGVEVLEQHPWPGHSIPIVKVIGDEHDIEGKVRYSGIVRNAKDAQRTYNYSVTSEMEVVALQPKAPYIGAEGQFEGHENDWKQANTKSYAYLEYRQKDLEGQPAPPPIRLPFTTQPSTWAAMKQAAAADMQATTGIRFDATIQERVYDESGRALRELRKAGDMGSFHYTDNLARSLRRQGEIYLDLIPKVLSERQVATILREDDSEEQILIDPGAEKASGDGEHPLIPGRSIKVFNPKIGKYGVTVTIGPAYATRRIEAAESMMAFVRAMGPAQPQLITAIADIVAKYQDWPGAEEFQGRLAKLVAELHPNLAMPDIKDVPPQVQATLQSQAKQLQQLQIQLTAAMKQIADQNADRAQRQDKIDKDFEAKLIGIVAAIESKAAELQQRQQGSLLDLQQKRESEFDKKVGTQLQSLAEGVIGLRDALMQGVRRVEEDGVTVTGPESD